MVVRNVREQTGSSCGFHRHRPRFHDIVAHCCGVVFGHNAVAGLHFVARLVGHKCVQRLKLGFLDLPSLSKEE